MRGAMVSSALRLHDLFVMCIAPGSERGIRDWRGVNFCPGSAAFFPRARLGPSAPGAKEGVERRPEPALSLVLSLAFAGLGRGAQLRAHRLGRLLVFLGVGVERQDEEPAVEERAGGRRGRRYGEAMRFVVKECARG